MCPEVDRILDIMSQHRRRMILLLLKRETVDTTEDVLMWGPREPDTSDIPYTHNHLPKLEDIGYIHWDRATGEISKGPCFDEIVPLLELFENHADELPTGWP